MSEILLWFGVGVVAAGALSRVYLATKSLQESDDMERFPERAKTMRLRRSYSRLAMIVGALIILISLYV
ncbi:MAG: hypothetical protein K2H74_07070 [Paramuribaculum sp.]|nr:hypothetical protein [Paramuribaculum sp.]